LKMIRSVKVACRTRWKLSDSMNTTHDNLSNGALPDCRPERYALSSWSVSGLGCISKLTNRCVREECDVDDGGD
jgi:hypothetical protein